MNLQNHTASELIDILRSYRYSDAIKVSAGEQLKGQNPTNDQLVYILRWCPSDAIKVSAASMLRASVGITVPVDEEKLIKDIAENVLARPGSLKMGSWHCGTSHCLAGWATTINAIARDLESKYSTEIAGAAVLPNYAKHFYDEDEQVLNILREKAGSPA